MDRYSPQRNFLNNTIIPSLAWFAFWAIMALIPFTNHLLAHLWAHPELTQTLVFGIPMTLFIAGSVRLATEKRDIEINERMKNMTIALQDGTESQTKLINHFSNYIETFAQSSKNFLEQSKYRDSQYKETNETINTLISILKKEELQAFIKTSATLPSQISEEISLVLDKNNNNISERMKTFDLISKNHEQIQGRILGVIDEKLAGFRLQATHYAQTQSALIDILVQFKDAFEGTTQEKLREALLEGDLYKNMAESLTEENKKNMENMRKKILSIVEGDISDEKNSGLSKLTYDRKNDEELERLRIAGNKIVEILASNQEEKNELFRGELKTTSAIIEKINTNKDIKNLCTDFVSRVSKSKNRIEKADNTGIMDQLFISGETIQIAKNIENFL